MRNHTNEIYKKRTEKRDEKGKRKRYKEREKKGKKRFHEMFLLGSVCIFLCPINFQKLSKTVKTAKM